MKIVYWDRVGKSWNMMWSSLFKPFDAGKWFTIGFCAFLSGASILSSGGGGGGGFNPSDWDSDDDPSSSCTSCVLDSKPQHILPQMDWPPFKAQHNALPSECSSHTTDDKTVFAWVAGLIAIITPLFIGLMILFMWLQARGQFMFLDNTINDRGAVKEPWKRYKRPANSLLLWQLLLGLMVLLAFAAIYIPPFLPYLTNSKSIESCFDSVSAFCSVFLIPIILSILLLIIITFIQMLIYHFVIPVMFKHECSFSEGFKRLGSLLSNGGAFKFILFGLMLWLLNMGISLAVMLAIISTCCILLIPLSIPYLSTVFQLPFLMWLRLLGPTFMAQFGEEFDLLSGAPIAEPPPENAPPPKLDIPSPV